jgi:hypothetical protein
MTRLPGNRTTRIAKGSGTFARSTILESREPTPPLFIAIPPRARLAQMPPPSRPARMPSNARRPPHATRPRRQYPSRFPLPPLPTFVSPDRARRKNASATIARLLRRSRKMSTAPIVHLLDLPRRQYPPRFRRPHRSASRQHALEKPLRPNFRNRIFQSSSIPRSHGDCLP